MTDNTNYDSSSIRVLKGLEPVKTRPGMYTRTENPNHIIYEVIDIAQIRKSCWQIQPKLRPVHYQ